MDNGSCHICDYEPVQLVPGYEKFIRITSDCRPWSANGRLFICAQCGFVQKTPDEVWQSETENIYQEYNIYHQGDGKEQAVFEQVSGKAVSRSLDLVQKINNYFNLPTKGRVLDIGCGNGSLLRSFVQIKPEWSLVGTELDNKYLDNIKSIEQVEDLFICSPENVPGTFNLIAMVHLLEHIPNPGLFLEKLINKLNPGGLLVIETPDYRLNPFDLLIADHCTHFSAYSLPCFLRKYGFKTLKVTTDWIPKELTVLAGVNNSIRSDQLKTQIFDPNSLLHVQRGIEWLNNIIIQARELSKKGNFGIFGTSIAGTWLASELEGKVDFFVDEDSNRIGKIYMGCPIYHPQEVPAGSNIFIALPDVIAVDIYKRLYKQNLHINLYKPPSHSLLDEY